ncbi:MAG: DUF3558 domain-containing protein [Pseudonocardiaceae bacterium]
MHRTPAVVALAMLLVGCSTGGAQSTGASPAPASSAGAPADPIPPVRDPKNLAGTPPCALLTPAQLATNQMDLPAQRKDVSSDPGCEWDNKAHTREITIHMDTSHDVLHNVYAQRETFAVFEITQVGAHPAIRTKENVDGTSCFFRVAVADRQTFTLRFTSLRQGTEEPCGPARALAEDVLANLPPLNS